MNRSQERLDTLYSASSSRGDTAGRRESQLYVTRSEGTRLHTQDGRVLIDMQMFNSASNFGYSSALHNTFIADQLHRTPGVGSEFLTPERVELANKIAVSIEERLGVKGRVHFSVSGAQAVDDALKLIAATTGRRAVFAFEGGYHGRTYAASSISASYRYRHGFGSETRAQYIPFPYCDRCAYGKTYPECALYCLEQFKRILEHEACGTRDPVSGEMELTAFIAEPVLGRGGYIPAPIEYFPRLKKILESNGILLVIDDIQMGFYRSGKLWTMEHYGVAPDIILFGKSISNGTFPVSGLWAREPLMSRESWVPSSTHTTFGGHPVGMAAGLATFELIEGQDLETHAEALGHALEHGLRSLMRKIPQIGAVRRLGLALGVEIIKDASGDPAPELTKAFKETCLLADITLPGERRPLGIVLTIGGFYDNILTIAPAVTMTDTEVNRFLALFKAYFERVLSSKESR